MEEFCKFYASKPQKLLFTEILEKRKRAVDKIRRHIVTDTGQSEITEDNFLKVVNAGHLGFMAKQVDAEFFDGRLLKTFEEKGCCLSFCMGNTCGSTAGLCSYRKGTKPTANVSLTIKMMPKVFIKSFKNKEIQIHAVDNLPCPDILTCFFMTFCHEVVHAIIFCNCNGFNKTDKGPGVWKGVTRPGNGHSKTFMSILNNRFGHTKFTHSLDRGVTVDQLESEVFGQHNIKVGDIVVVKLTNKDGGFIEKEMVVTSAGKVRSKAHLLEDPSKVYKNIYGSILRKVDYSKEKKTPILNAKPTKKVIEKDLTPKEEQKVKAPAPKKKVNQSLVKNLNVGDIIMINVRYSGKTEKERCSAKIIQLNRRKKRGIGIEILSGSNKGKKYTIGENVVERKPGNVFLPASPNKVEEPKPAPPAPKPPSPKLAPKAEPYKKVPFKIKTKPEIKTKKNNVIKPPATKAPLDCNKRNPAPPCGPGMHERKRPNGAICCYKGEDPNKSKKNSVKPQPKVEEKPKIQDAPKKIKFTIKKKVDKQENDCNKRNPAPPCGPGMHERKRPNGSICCYKGEPAAPTVKKQPVKTQKKLNNSKVDSQEKLYELDFAYKPVTLKDLDSQVDYKTLSSDLKKTVKTLKTLNWNMPLAERDTRTENPLLYDVNKKLSEIKDKFYILKISQTEDRYGPRENENIVLVRNEGTGYVRYGIRIVNYPKTAFANSGRKIW